MDLPSLRNRNGCSCCCRLGCACRQTTCLSDSLLKRLCLVFLLLLVAQLLFNALSVSGPTRLSWAVSNWFNSTMTSHDDVRNIQIGDDNRNIQRRRFYDIIFGILRTNIDESTPPICPAFPPDLGVRARKPSQTMLFSMDQLEKRLEWVEMGGAYRPENCTSRHRVALVIPYRDRDENLRIFLHHIHPFLKRQQIDYRLFVVEQTEPAAFNRGALMNIGFVEALKISPLWDCFIFHDVDLIPEHERNLYWCPDMPRHMSVAVDKFFYRLPYRNIFGGVEAFMVGHFQLINGFANAFFGWGGEDDDLYNRIVFKHLNLTRYPDAIARYTMLSHSKQHPSSTGSQLVRSGPERFEVDGLNSLTYDLEIREDRKLYTYFRVNLANLKQSVIHMLETVKKKTMIASSATSAFSVTKR